ncbi:MAG: COQ9 family protein [Geminicoccaceae bacterium]|nr:COQ9 family protein [Geminicoccaceae bacterium]
MSEATERRRAQKDAVLEAALMHAAFDGWSRRTVTNAAADAGLDRATAARLFPQGPASLLAWLDDWTDRRMLAAVKDEDITSLPVRRRIARLVQARLDALAPHKEAMRRAALARGLSPDAARGGRALWGAADLIWERAGFASGPGEGFSYYSRRTLLVGILLSTFFYWLDDTSENHADSWAFLDRRIDDALKLGKATGRLAGFFPFRRRTA